MNPDTPGGNMRPSDRPFDWLPFIFHGVVYLAIAFVMNYFGVI